MTIRIGTASVSWGIIEVDSSWGRTQTFSSVLDEMVSAGYDGAELGPWGFLPTDPKRLMAELARRSRCLIGGFVPIALVPAGNIGMNIGVAAPVAYFPVAVGRIVFRLTPCPGPRCHRVLHREKSCRGTLGGRLFTKILGHDDS